MTQKKLIKACKGNETFKKYFKKKHLGYWIKKLSSAALCNNQSPSKISDDKLTSLKMCRHINFSS